MKTNRLIKIVTVVIFACCSSIAVASNVINEITCKEGRQRIISQCPNVSPKYTVTENLGMRFNTPDNFVIIGRTHSGDETGKTHYYIGYIHVKK